MWDNRASKKNPKAPDYKCRTRTCEGVFWPGQWPPKDEQGDAFQQPATVPSDDDYLPPDFDADDDGLPF